MTIHDAAVAFVVPKPEPVLRCATCGDYKNDNPGICWNHDTPDGYPEPFGEAHVWIEVES